MRGIGLWALAVVATGCDAILGISDFQGHVDAGPDAGPPPFTVRSHTPALNGVAYGAGTFVAVGTAGTVMTSPDGMTWSSAASNTKADILGVSFNGTRFFAAVRDQPYIYSSDGSMWLHGSLVFTWMQAQADGSMAATVNENGITTSPDGLTWATTTMTPSDYYLYPPLVVLGGGQYVVQAQTDNTPPGVFVGSSLSSLTFHTTGQGTMSALAYGNGHFVSAGNNVHWSADGVGWTNGGGSGNYAGSRFLESRFVLVGWNGAVAYTNDGSAVTDGMPAGVYDLFDVAAKPGTNTLVAVGEVISRSTDAGASWGTVTAPASSLEAVAASDGTPGAAQFVAVGQHGRILTSFDGVMWHDTGFANSLDSITGVAFGNGIFVACSGTKSYTSTTGQTWTTHTGVNCGGWLTFGAGKFVGLDALNKQVLTSADGVSWSAPVYTFFNFVPRLRYAGGVFCAPADANTIYTSADASSWMARTVTGSLAETRWTDVTYGNGHFVAMAGGGGSDLASSADSVSWTATDLSLNGINFGGSIGFDGTRFLADATVEQTDLQLMAWTQDNDLTPLGSLTSLGYVAAFALNATTTPARLVAVGGESLVLTIP